jgi:hypothetical protein
MKKIYSIVAGILLTANVWAQAPQKMSFQAVIRNSSDALIKTTQVGMKISILQGSATGTVAYAETQTPTTNANGLVSLEIGKGTIVTGTFGSINWANGPYFIKTETDPAGGTTYTVAGTSELMSVPYALFSANGTPGPAGPKGDAGANGILPNGAAAGNTPFWNGTAWVTNSSNIFNNGAFVGLGTTTPSNPLTIQHNYVGGGIMNSGNGANGPSYILANNGTEGGSYGLSNGVGNHILGSQSGDITFRNVSTTRGILFSTGGTPFNSRLAILANGNIGIGTITPDAPLTFDGTGQKIHFYNSQINGYSIGVESSELRIAGGTSNIDAITFKTQGYNGTERMRINGSGNIGIGTTAPTAKLDVAGSVKIVDGTQGKGKVLTSDSLGLATWSEGPAFYSFPIIVGNSSIPIKVGTWGAMVTFNLYVGCGSANNYVGTMYIRPNGNVTILNYASNDGVGYMTASNNVITLTTGCTPSVLTVNASGGNASFAYTGPSGQSLNLKMSVIAN